MNSAVDWFRFGPFALRERVIVSPDSLSGNCSFAIFTPSWEERALGCLEANRINITNGFVLDFEVETDRSAAVNAQKAKLLCTYNKLKPLSLLSSLRIAQNLHKIRGELQKIFDGGCNSLFIDITSLPKSYIQSLVGWIFVEGLFPHVQFGYAEGIYRDSPSIDASVGESVSFESAKPLIGMSVCREKRLYAVLGGERANCYALIERLMPDYLHIFATRSERHTVFEEVMNNQIDKLKAEYSDKIVQIVDVDAFSLKSFIEKFERGLFKPDSEVAITIFPSGTKPHALASAIVGASYRHHVEVRYRTMARYGLRSVDWSKRYHVYDVVDLRSERLPLCSPF